MGFATEFTSLGSTMITKASGFISDLLPIIGAVAGLAFAGLALVYVKRFFS